MRPATRDALARMVRPARSLIESEPFRGWLVWLRVGSIAARPVRSGGRFIVARVRRSDRPSPFEKYLAPRGDHSVITSDY